jgi:hypothetical protein
MTEHGTTIEKQKNHHQTLVMIIVFSLIANIYLGSVVAANITQKNKPGAWVVQFVTSGIHVTDLSVDWIHNNFTVTLQNTSNVLNSGTLTCTVTDSNPADMGCRVSGPIVHRQT